MKAYIRLIFILISFVACVTCVALSLFGILINILPPFLTIVSVCSVLFGTFYNIKRSDKSTLFRVVGIVLALAFTFFCVGSIMFAQYRTGEASALLSIALTK